MTKTSRPSRSTSLVGFALACCAAACTQQSSAPPAPAFTAPTSACGAGAIAEVSSAYGLGSGEHALGESQSTLGVDANGVVLGLDGQTNSVIAGSAPDGGLAAIDSTGERVLGVHLDATSIYYSTPSGLYSVPRGGGTAQTLSHSALGAFALGANDVYAVLGGPETTPATVVAIPKTGGPSSVVYSAPAGKMIWDVSIDGNTVYWDEEDPVFNDFQNPLTILRSAPVAPTLVPTELASLPLSANLTVALGADSGTLVYVAVNLGGTDAFIGSVYTLQAGGSLVLVDQAPLPTAYISFVPLSVAGGFAYYDLGAGVKRFALDGSTPVTTLAQPTEPLVGLAADTTGTFVYGAQSCVYRSTATL